MILDNVEYLDHMTDAYIRCRGKTLADSFQYSAKGLVSIMYDVDKIVLTEFKITLYLNKELDKYLIEGYGEGDFVNFEKHEFNVEIKGITYHQMKISHDQNTDEFVIEYIVDL